MYENFKSNKELFQKCFSAKHVCCSSAHFPPSEAQFPKEQTSIYKAFKNTAIVTGLVSYILTLFPLDILSANIFFFPDCKRMSTRSEVCIMYYCLCCTKVRYETHFSPFQCPLPLSLGLHLTNITNAQCAVCTVCFPCN